VKIVSENSSGKRKVCGGKFLALSATCAGETSKAEASEAEERNCVVQGEGRMKNS